jgi:GH18 family chitinase
MDNYERGGGGATVKFRQRHRRGRKQQQSGAVANTEHTAAALWHYPLSRSTALVYWLSRGGQFVVWVAFESDLMVNVKGEFIVHHDLGGMRSI